MFIHARLFILVLLVGLAPAAFAGVVSIPGLGDPVFSEGDVQFAFAQGRATGGQEAAALCIGDPANCGCVEGLAPCGITLSSVLTGAQFGETEPNDHIVAADPLITQVVYWGQSRDAADEDWFYLTTFEPNQILTLTFTVPDRSLAGLAGWQVQVRDAAGNVYYQFNTSLSLGSEYTFPVFLGHVGTYYVVVTPVGTTGLPYNIAAVLSFSALDAAPPDVNFHDVEVEKNNDSLTANPLASGTSMFGFLHQNELEASTQEIAGDEDWYSYSTPGNEQIVLAWCGKEACSDAAIWTIEVRNPDDTLLLSTTTDKAETLRFALGPAGTYYFRVRYQVKTDSACIERSETEIVCKADEVLTCMKDENNQYSDDACTAAANSTGTGYDGSKNTELFAAQTTTAFCTSGILAPDTGCNVDGVFPPHPMGNDPLEGAARFRSYQYQTLCTAGVEFKCLVYDNVIDANALNVQYNFTWWGTKLLPLTNGSDAFDVFLERPGFYMDR